MHRFTVQKKVSILILLKLINYLAQRLLGIRKKKIRPFEKKYEKI